MKFFAALSLASMALAHPHFDIMKDFQAGVKSAFAPVTTGASGSTKSTKTPLDVEIKVVGNSAVHATISNNGNEDLNVLKTGSFLDKIAVEKIHVFSNNSKVAFDGIRLNIDTSLLKASNFQLIPAGKYVEVDFDAAELHDLSAGGDFDLLAEGRLGYAEVGSTKLIGTVPYSSNRLKASIDGEKAFAVHRAFYKRTELQSNCTAEQHSMAVAALQNCASMAAAAAAAAYTGDRMVEFFKENTTETRNTVVTVFNNVLAQCSTTTGGGTEWRCDDPYPACTDGVIAYTLAALNYMAYCPIFFSKMPAQASLCHAQSQAQTVVHESTHLSQVKGTSDYGGYGYDVSMGLDEAEDLNHADTYALYADAVRMGCSPGDNSTPTAAAA